MTKTAGYPLTRRQKRHRRLWLPPHVMSNWCVNAVCA